MAIAIWLEAQQGHKYSMQEAPARRNKLSMAESSVTDHPTGKRRKKTNWPLAQAKLPDLPPLPTGSDESDQLKEKYKKTAIDFDHDGSSLSWIHFCKRKG